MADRIDSIHIKIKIDVAEESKEFQQNLASNLERADQQSIQTKKKLEKLGPPTRTEFETQQLEKTIEKLEKKRKKKPEKKTNEELLQEKKQDLNTLQLKIFNEGPVGKLNKITSEQTSNIMQIATNPGGFFVKAFAKILGKYGTAARGGLYAVIALLVYEIVLFAIRQLMEPGRWLDRRFRRIARVETMNFYERTLQEEIRHGYQEIRVTTMEGLRGGQSQVNGNFFEFSSGATGILQSSPYRSSQEIYGHAYLSGTGIDNRGNPKKRTVSGRFS